MPTPKPLPDCEGPKLECFTDDITKHNFKLLDYLGGGCHSKVLKAEIDDKIYVIKFFFRDTMHEPHFEMTPIDDYTIDADEYYPLVASDEIPQRVVDSLRLHATSFNNECRAYGRLKELGCEHLALKAHGYLRVYLHQIEEQLQDAYRRAYPAGPPRSAQFLMRHDDADAPIMAIVKDWVPDHRTTATTMTREAENRQLRHLPRMLRNLRQLHRCGIVVRDLKAQQYYEGQLGDFSHSWTIPHVFDPEGGIRPPWTFASMAAWDLKCFQLMIEDANKSARRAEPPLRECNSSAWRNYERYSSLRPRPGTQRPFLPLLNYDDGGEWEMNYDPPYDPALFNWKAVQKRTTHKSIGNIPKKESTGGFSKKRKTTTAGRARRENKGKSKKRNR
ncbi:hypothetical protein FPHYL_4501 [Fusarium phyllophilum]|uniref:Protein kinase domain-containing protein n=1 Tax=Fusarium phyllophilum TaxID=47803 RepID=A0A8H5NG14_9HYPO|nr:hypothetical protein FPHYL_4501 [Fusarium phyllophilum]